MFKEEQLLENPACHAVIGVARVLAYLVIFCVERRGLKQNTVTCKKSKDMPPQNFGLATPLMPVER